MKIAFYSPLKSPNHPVPSGDRLMARLLISALEKAGHEVQLVSELRAFIRDPSIPAVADLLAEAEMEKDRIAAQWRASAPPDAWFCYHLYYKAPDLLGPALAREFGIAYLTAEASYSNRRNSGIWTDLQDRVLEAVRLADVNICLTERDRDGLLAAAPDARLTVLPPFIDPALMLERRPEPQSGRLITVAMMRPGDKMQSYFMLAEALARLAHLPWTLSIVGDGPQVEDVRALFTDFEAERIVWHGEKTAPEIADLLATSSIYLWPGCGEAFGLAYLEAQAAGLPVVAQAVAGVPSVVVNDRTGLLTPPDDVAAYAQAVERLLTDDGLRARLASEARIFVSKERSIDRAATTLADVLDQYVKRA